MDKNGVKINILWPKENQWQFCKYRKRNLNLSRAIYVFGKRKRILEIRFRIAGSKYKELRGSLIKIPTNGYVKFSAVDLESNGLD